MTQAVAAHQPSDVLLKLLPGHPIGYGDIAVKLSLPQATLTARPNHQDDHYDGRAKRDHGQYEHDERMITREVKQRLQQDHRCKHNDHQQRERVLPAVASSAPRHAPSPFRLAPHEEYASCYIGLRVGGRCDRNDEWRMEAPIGRDPLMRLASFHAYRTILLMASSTYSSRQAASRSRCRRVIAWGDEGGGRSRVRRR